MFPLIRWWSAPVSLHTGLDSLSIIVLFCYHLVPYVQTPIDWCTASPRVYRCLYCHDPRGQVSRIPGPDFSFCTIQLLQRFLFRFPCSRRLVADSCVPYVAMPPSWLFQYALSPSELFYAQLCTALAQLCMFQYLPLVSVTLL